MMMFNDKERTMSEDNKPESLTNIGLDSALLENSDIKVGEGNYSEAIRSAVQRSTPKKKVNGLPYGVHTKQEQTEKQETDSKRKAKKELGDKRIPLRMQAFATYVALGDSPREAVLKAYNCAKSSQASILKLANRLMNDARVSVLLQSLTSVTKEAILKEELKTRQKVLDELYDHAMHEDNPLSLRIRSLELLGKSVGMFTDRVETKADVHDIDQLKKELEQSMNLHNETNKVRQDLTH
jgi:hypothetical protein